MRRDELAGCLILLMILLSVGAIIVVWVQLARELVLWVN